MNKFDGKSNERLSAESSNIDITLKITPKEKILALDDRDPKFIAKFFHLVDE